MKISEFLAPDDVLLNVEATNKIRLLRQLSARAALRMGLDANVLSEAIVKREALGSTGVGSGIALPHARLERLERPFGLLARLRRKLDYEAIDEQPVDLVLLLLLPEARATQILACAARALRDKAISERLRRAESSSVLYSEISAASTA